jgi:hypothetical protein
MPAADQIEIRRLDGTALHAQLDALAGVLADCVAGGASVSYLAPFSHEQARAVFEAMAAEVEQGRRLLLGAFADGRLVGTVQVILSLPPNQPTVQRSPSSSSNAPHGSAALRNCSWSVPSRRLGRKARPCWCWTR